MSEVNDFQFKVILQCEQEGFNPTRKQYCEYLVEMNGVERPLRDILKENIEQQATIQRFEEYVFSDERIICYNCLFCQEKDIYEVKCEIKGSVDVHGKCQYYEKKED